jgi:hypothetical protein
VLTRSLSICTAITVALILSLVIAPANNVFAQGINQPPNLPQQAQQQLNPNVYTLF